MCSEEDGRTWGIKGREMVMEDCKAKASSSCHSRSLRTLEWNEDILQGQTLSPPHRDHNPRLICLVE